ncbi:MAG: amidohydrolase family protein [Planctomycetota bacterium]
MPRFQISQLRQSLFAAAIAITAFHPTGPAIASDQIPGARQTRPVALTNAVIHPVTGPVIERGTLVFTAGRIAELGANVQPPNGSEVIDLQGKHVYPGLIEAHTQLGLTEISSTRATVDHTESGFINPSVAAHVAVNPDSELIPVTRANGVLTALTAPSGGLVSGQAAVIQLDGWTWEQMTLKPRAALVINWPRISAGTRRSLSRSENNEPASAENPVRQLRDLFTQARAYGKARAANPAEQRFDARLAAIHSVLENHIPLLVNADRLDQINSAVAFAVEQQTPLIIFGGYDAPECAALLKQYDVPVIVSAIHREPLRNHDDYDASFTLPERLRQAGVRFCISGSARSETWNARNLPWHAATAAAYGLPKDEALKAITLYPARILGMADRLGALEPGRDATLFVSTGDPLETEPQVTNAWIQGRRVDLSSKHSQLYQKYQEKYRQLAQP